MLNKLLLILLLFILLILYSCNQTGSNNMKSDRIAVYIDTIPITINQVDNKIRQEIYDELNRIYLLRKIAIEEILKEKLLTLEASKNKMTELELIDSLYQYGIRSGKMNKFFNDNQYYKGIPVLNRSIKYLDVNSVEGNETFIERFKDNLLKDYIDSLKIVYKTKILIEPPVSPTFIFKNLLVHYRGNLKSNVTFLVISDFECGMCREFNPVFDSLYFKYKDKVRFGYQNFGSYVTISAIAAECAAKQGKFWEMHDSIYSSSVLPDTSDVFRIAKNLGIGNIKFKTDFNDKSVYSAIEEDLHLVIDAGIYATPTIMINNKPIFNSSSISEIEQALLKELAIQN